MSTVKEPDVYSELVDLLAELVDPDRLLAFQISPEKQARLQGLLDKNRDGELTDAESAELDTFEHLEHVVRILKARVVQKRKP